MMTGSIICVVKDSCIMYNRSNQRINYFKYLNRQKFQSLESPYYFSYGRTALKEGLTAVNFPPGKKILIPNYICDAALEPFNELGIGITYYSVNEDLSPDWDSLKKNLTKDAASIMMVHYFGIPQDIELFINFSKENDLLLVEDNSHGHGGLNQNQLLGTFGDIGISSPRKSFPILNGGILFLNKGKKITKNNFPLEPIDLSKLIIRDIFGRILDNTVTIKNVLLQKLDSKADSASNIKSWSIDKVSYNLLNKFDLAEVRKVRSNLFKIWENWCKVNDLSPLFSLKSDSHAPLSFPLLFKNENERNKWYNTFKKKHVAAYLWPDLPPEISKTVNSGKDLYNRILCLPIHLSMKEQELNEFLSEEFLFE
jgi:perosamine synthetase